MLADNWRMMYQRKRRICLSHHIERRQPPGPKTSLEGGGLHEQEDWRGHCWNAGALPEIPENQRAPGKSATPSGTLSCEIIFFYCFFFKNNILNQCSIGINQGDKKCGHCYVYCIWVNKNGEKKLNKSASIKNR
jgi:hypothetical protein